MIVEERSYRLHAGKVPEYLRLYREEGRAIQEPILGHMVGWFTANDIGDLNTIVHLWGYDDLADRAARRARMAADPDWQAFVAKLQPHNAGIYTSLVPQPLEELGIDEWRRVFDVNVLGTFLATRAVLPQMRAQGGGRIVNIASGTPFKGVPYLLHYVASKGAVVAMTKAIAKEVGDSGILVNTVAPGFTMSDGVLANPVQVQKLQEISVKARVIQRDQFPSDVVGAIVFFCSDDSSFITGQSLVVDGGAFFN